MTTPLQTGFSGILRAIINRKLELPLFAWRVQCGFPSPAENYVERVCERSGVPVE